MPEDLLLSEPTAQLSDEAELRLWEDQDEWTEIRYRVRDPDDFQDDSFRRKAIKKDKPRVIGIFGRLKGEDTLTLQSLRFPKDDGWTLAKAKEWVKDHPDVRSEEWVDRPHRVQGVEYRAFPGAEFRVIGDDDAPRIEGHAAVFNQLSEEMYGFREKIAPGAFSRTIKQADIRFLFNHDPNYILGRNKAGNLRLSEDELGLAVDNDPPKTPTIRDLVLEPMRRKDLTQMSFSFTVSKGKEEWDFTQTPAIRTLLEIRLFDVSAVTFPAYPGTDVTVRSIAGMTPPLDFERLIWLMAKRSHGLGLSAEETEVINQAVEQLTQCLHADPDLAAHSAQGAADPSKLLTLRRRLKRIALQSRAAR